MAKSAANKIAEDMAQKRVADLYSRLRQNAAKIAYSTYGPQDPDMEQVDKELGNKPEE